MKADERTPLTLFAHTPPEGSDNWHRLDDHLRAVAELAAQFGAPFGAGDEARLAGLLHDAGKAGDLFQEYLRACQAGERGEVVSGAPRAPHTEGRALTRTIDAENNALVDRPNPDWQRDYEERGTQ